MLSSQERVELGLRQLGKDIVSLYNGKSHDSDETIAESKCKPIVQNIINNYTNRTESPTQKVKFGFMDVARIAFCIMVIVIVAKILLEPMWFVDGFNSWVEFFHSF